MILHYQQNLKVIMRKYLLIIVLLILLLSDSSCSDRTDARISEFGEPVEFNFLFEDQKSNTRGTTPLDRIGRTVYVTSDGQTFYRYVYDSSTSRWVAQGENKLVWTSSEMTLYAFVRLDGAVIDKDNLSVGIASSQVTEGYESSDFLACGGTYSYGSGVIPMTLKHKVAKMVVYISNCLDASQMTCETNFTLPTSASVALSAGNVSLSTSNEKNIKMYRSTYNSTEQTATFISYVFPQSSVSTSFKIGCGNLEFTTSATSSVQLIEGQTSEINISMPEITKVTDYSYTGKVQTFTAPVTGNYLLEVWGAQGGSYDYARNPWSDYDLQMLGIGLCEGGLGAYVRGVVSLAKGDKLYVHVGGQGTGSVANGTRIGDPVSGQYVPTTGAAEVSYNYYVYQLSGGWNGGGSVYLYDQLAVQTSAKGVTPVTNAPREQGGGGGGGATDISTAWSGTENLWRNDTHLQSRIIVAGGGGGGCYVPTQKGWYTGGYGGGGASWAGETGAGDGNSRGFGGSLTTFGPHGQGSAAGNIRAINNVESFDIVNIQTGSQIPIDGGFGFGGSGRWGESGGESLGAGGGGWYGGGCANGTGSNGAGGGGSSYAYTTEVSYNGQTLASYWPSGVTAPDTKYLLKSVLNQVNAQSGNGKARITLLTE